MPPVRTAILLALAAAPLLAGCGRNWPLGGGGGGGEVPDAQLVPPDEIPFPLPTPEFGPTVTQAVPPPPISGGTLAILADGTTAVAADPDRDRIYVVDLATETKLAEIALQPGDQPGRVIEDGAGRVHVVLRGGGALVTLDPATWTIAARRAVCPAPRGVAWDPATDLVHVACAGGELVSLPAAGGAATRTVQLDRDLRDVAVLDGVLYVSRFRTAELLTLDASGHVTRRQTPATYVASFGSHAGARFEPDAAWRLVASPGDHALYMLHQRALDDVVSTTMHGGYGGGDPCHDPIVQTTITRWVPGQSPTAGAVLAGAVVPTDLALSPISTQDAVIAAGNAKVTGMPVVFTSEHGGQGGGGGDDCDGSADVFASDFEPTSVAYTGDGQRVVLSREPAELLLVDGGTRIPLSDVSREDTGHAVFHANAGGFIACASCHLEGGDDGRVWQFDTVGPRRTQSLRGGVLGTEPFHWDGDQADFGHLMSEVFVHRMSGPPLAADQLDAMKSWTDHIPLLPKAPGDAAAIARGKALFDDVNGAGCVTCHGGAELTNNATVNVGTGGMFQVPSLRGVIDRAPYLHDGRAATLADRFTVGGGDLHGHTSQLTPAQLSDLIAYLGSL